MCLKAFLFIYIYLNIHDDTCGFWLHVTDWHSHILTTEVRSLLHADAVAEDAERPDMDLNIT